MENLHLTVLRRFSLDSEPCSCERYGCGHINETYLVVTRSGRRYILQKLSNRAFPDIAALQENVAAVTAHLRKKVSDPNGVLTLIPTVDGKTWYHHAPNSDWRVYDFIENAICLQSAETAEDFYQSAIAFGTFQQQLADFPAETLHETIARFHDTPNRYALFRQALAADAMGRADRVRAEIDFAMAHEQLGSRLIRLRDQGALPLRVTHNDTKLNNVMLRAADRTPLCVIDLDTTMPGLSAFDFGDSIRFGAATAAEDETDLRKMTVDLEKFRLFTRGFLQACPGLTETERTVLPLGALTMTLECGVRFLTDYLDGDRYFGIHRPDHNLDRARTQFKLVAEMEKNLPAMEQIVREETR